MTPTFEQMLTGGHPNSLGRTLEVVALIEDEPVRLRELIDTYRSDDEVVRLRVSNAVKRTCIAHPDQVAPYLDELLDWVATIDQPSTQWTLALLYDRLRPWMTTAQQTAATKHMQHNLEQHHDWIVLNNTMQVLFEWREVDPSLTDYLRPNLVRLTGDPRRSVAARARRLLEQL